MDITHFCAEEDSRYPLSETWVKDHWRYATDGCIAVREPTADPDSEGKYGPRNLAEFSGQVAGFFDDHLRGCHFGQLPEVPQHDGRGKDCQEPSCYIGPASKQPDCSKFGRCPATQDSECTNLRLYRVLDPQEVAGHKWGGRYIQIINDEMPGARYHVTDEGIMQFVCDSVEGVLGHTRAE